MTTGGRHQPLWDRVWTSHRHLMAPPSLYQQEPFRIVERRFAPRYLAQTETLFTVANGYLGVRGCLDESSPSHQRATLINGFHETWPIVYGEEAYGFAKTGQTIVPVPDGTLVKLYVDDEPFHVGRAHIHESERVFDMGTGLLERRVVWETADGRRLRLTSRRLASLEFRHLLLVDYEVEVLDAPATLTISSELTNLAPTDDDRDDPRASKTFDSSVLEPVEYHVRDPRLVFSLRTRSSGMTMACGMEHVVDTECEHTHRLEGQDDEGRVVFLVDGEPGCPVRLTKFVGYHASPTAPSDELCFRVGQTLDRAIHVGTDAIVDAQKRRVDEFWESSDVRVESGTPELQSAIRFNLFQVLQASARADGHGLPAKGLTGTGYEGHYFWDSEIYVMPLLTYTQPKVARNLLGFRSALLDSARKRAREVGHRGALYPWRTINGDEASAYYAAGTAQYHINADIMYAVGRYTRATGDLEFLATRGVEMLIETARLWTDLGFFSNRHDGQFLINGVTGPDEYSAVVNNNLFTNLMARENLLSAVDAVEWLKLRRPDDFDYVAHRTELDLDELTTWRRAAQQMFVPYDQEAAVHLQDDAFLEREVWDFEHTPPDRYPLLLHFHPLEIYRHQVIKQADVVLSTFLLGYWFTYEQKKRIFEYYDPLTTGDSSLSKCIQAVMAAELGLMDRACEYFAAAVLLDLLDLAGNVRDGLHIASAGGTWLALVHGFGGLRDHDGELRFQPAIPDGWGRLTFRLRQRSQLIEISACHDDVSYTLVEGTRAVVHHWDREVVLELGEKVSLPNPRTEEVPRLPHQEQRPGFLEREPWSGQETLEGESRAARTAS